MQTKKIILASNSPRRKDLLKANGFDFEVIVSDYEESNFTLDPILTAKTFAKEKVLDVYKSLENKTTAVDGDVKGRDDAERIVREAIENYKACFGK